MSTRIDTLRRRQIEARARLAEAELSPKQKGRKDARRLFILATAELLRTELNHRRAAPLLRANARPQQTGDLFAQIGA